MIAQEKKKLLVEIDEVLDGKENGNLITNIERHLLGMEVIPDFNGFGDDKQHDKDFEPLCAYLQKETRRNSKDMTVMDVYSLMAIVYVKKKAKIFV